MLRAFIAIQLSDTLRRQIGELQSQLKRQAPVLRGLSWVRPDNIHLTLRFLGDIEESQLKALGEMLERAAAAVGPFMLAVRGLGAFPSLQRARVLWLGVTGESEQQMEMLRRLQTMIEEGVIDLGFQPEERSFSPHLTLARVKERGAASSLAGAFVSERDRLVGSLQASSVALIKSELRPQGAMYTSLVEVPFRLPV